MFANRQTDNDKRRSKLPAMAEVTTLASTRLKVYVRALLHPSGFSLWCHVV